MEILPYILLMVMSVVNITLSIILIKIKRNFNSLIELYKIIQEENRQLKQIINRISLSQKEE